MGRSRPGLCLPALGFVALALSSDAALAQGVVIQPAQVTVFLPRLQTLLTAELHFVKKVCSPDAEQFDNIHRVGREKILALANRYSELKGKRVKVGSWPPPAETVIETLKNAVSQYLPADVAETYREEIAARLDARRAADVSAVVVLIDRQVVLGPDQQQELFQALRGGWQPHWSDAYVSLIYPNYAVFPQSEILSPYLADLQQRLWAGRPRRRYASLMWQLRLGVYDMFEIQGLADFDDPDSDVDTVEPK